MGADDGLCCKASPGYRAETGHSRTGIPGTWRKVEGHKVDLGVDAGGGTMVCSKASGWSR